MFFYFKFKALHSQDIAEIFCWKIIHKCAAETIPKRLSKISKLSISLDHWCKVLNSLFLLHANLRAIET